jgi:alpha-beta hydrolase superfamily lysophospholipase
MTPQGVVAIIHGYGHHTACFEELAGHLCDEGFLVCGFDQRGHGLSPGKRGHIDSFATFVDDTDHFLSTVREDMPDLPLFLLGHSLGGLILGRYVVKYRPDVSGLIFSSGLLKIPGRVSPTLLRIGDLLSTLAPWLPVEKVDYRWVSRDATVLETIMQDPLRHSGRMSARTGAEIARAIGEFQQTMQAINDPLLVFHGTSDRLTDVEGSRTFFNSAGSEDKTLHVYEGGYHELFNDLEKERFAAELCAWLAERA